MDSGLCRNQLLGTSIARYWIELGGRRTYQNKRQRSVYGYLLLLEVAESDIATTSPAFVTQDTWKRQKRRHKRHQRDGDDETNQHIECKNGGIKMNLITIKGVGGYASVTEDGKNIYVRGQYGRSATIPIEDVEKVLFAHNSETQGDRTLAQITGSSGPSDDFVLFYNSKQQKATDAKEAEDVALTGAMAAKEAAERAAERASGAICVCVSSDVDWTNGCHPCNLERKAQRAQRRADRLAKIYLGFREAAFDAVHWLEDPAFCSE